MRFTGSGAEGNKDYKFETVDFMCPQNRWRNGCKNVENDSSCWIGTDHVPLIGDFKFKLKKVRPQGKARVRYCKATLQRRVKFNKRAGEIIRGRKVGITDAMKSSAGETLKRKICLDRKVEASEELVKLIEERDSKEVWEEKKQWNNKNKCTD